MAHRIQRRWIQIRWSYFYALQASWHQFWFHRLVSSYIGNYHEYFNEHLDEDAIVYLMVANLLAKNIYPEAILIAEDVSGFPGLCRDLEDGGIGFNYRLAMAVPDMWIKLLK